jgi:trimeric autotransporter adhesin
VAKALVITPKSLSFGKSFFGGSTGAASRPRNLIISNPKAGNQNVTVFVGNISVSGPFSIPAGACLGFLSPGGRCSVPVSFTPSLFGGQPGRLSVSANARSIPLVSLSGTGAAGKITVAPRALKFGRVTVGRTSAPLSVTLSNPNAANLDLGPINISGSGFGITANTCGTALASGASCAIEVTITPAARGKAPGQLSINDAALQSPQVVKLSGVGL